MFWYFGIKCVPLWLNGIDPLTLTVFRIAMESKLNEILSTMGDTLKIVSTIACLSESIDSVIMWSHYAQNHEGFALEYDLRHLLVQKEMNCCIFLLYMMTDALMQIALFSGIWQRDWDLMLQIPIRYHISKWQFINLHNGNMKMNGALFIQRYNLTRVLVQQA